MLKGLVLILLVVKRNKIVGKTKIQQLLNPLSPKRLTSKSQTCLTRLKDTATYRELVGNAALAITMLRGVYIHIFLPALSFFISFEKHR